MTDSYIDYNEELQEEPSWRHSDLKKYWIELVVDEVYAYTPLWTIKEQTLLSRMMKEFPPKDIAEMMYYWIDRNDPIFTKFYNERVATYRKLKEQQEGYKWS